MMLNAIPFFGWFLSLFFSISLAVPFYIAWTGFSVGATYFYWLPPVYHSIGFWDSVWLLMVLSILKAVLVPKFASVSNSNEAKS
jgi:hypothetical protein